MRPKILLRSKGQVLLEYVLLLVVTVGIASIIMRTLVRRDPNEPGALLNRWNGIILQIGKDDPNKSTP